MTGLLSFTITKYYEIFSLALTLFLLANKIGPIEMGVAMPVLLFLTYSNYLNIGAAQIVLKYQPRTIECDEQENLNIIAIRIFFFSSIAALFLAFFFISIEFLILTSLIASTVYFKSYCLAVYRVKSSYSAIKISNLVSPTFLLFMVAINADDFGDYLRYLLISNVISIIIFLLNDNSILVCLVKITKKINRHKTIYYIKSGVKISLVSILITMMLTLDKIYLQLTGSVTLELGVYQLSDNIATAVYMIITTIIYYFYPILLRKIAKDHQFEFIYCKFVLLSSLSLPVVFFISKILSDFLAPILFPDFLGLNSIVPNLIILKISIVYLSFTTTLLIAKSKEYRSIILQIVVIIITAISLLIAYKFGFDDIHIVPIIISIPVITTSLIYIYAHGKNTQKNNS